MIIARTEAEMPKRVKVLYPGERSTYINVKLI